MELNREKLKRMFEDANGNGGSANGGGGGGSLAGYATQAWVNEGFVSVDFFNRLFTVYGPGETSSDPDVVIEPNDLDSTIKNIKAMFGLWTEQYLSALGLNPGGTGSATSLGMLDDVDITTPTNGQALVYNATSLKWENQTISTVTALANLTDVLLTSPAANQVLVYDGTQWVNSSVKTVNGYSILGTGDIPASGGGTGNYLPLAGGTMTGVIQMNPGAAINYTGYTSDYIRMPYRIQTTQINKYLGLGIAEVSGVTYGSIGFANDLYGQGMEYYIKFSPSYPIYVYSKTELDAVFFPGNNTKQCCVLFCEGYNFNYKQVTQIGTNGDESSWMYNYLSTHYISISSTDGVESNTFIKATGFRNSTSLPQEEIVFQGQNNGAYFRTLKRGIAVTNSGLTTSVILGNNGSYAELYYNGGSLILQAETGSSYVGIGTTSPSYTLHVSGSIYATGAITALSDIKQKNVEQYDAHLGFDDVANAPIIKFTWKDPKAEDKGLQVGSIAQYWEKVLPEAVKKDKEGTLSMSYGVVALVAAVSTAKKVQEHERRIAELERENHRLKEMLNIA